MAASQLDLSGHPGARCAALTMRADEAVCDKSVCHLIGGARIACDALIMVGDRIDITMNPDQSFAGAVGSGNVVLVEGIKVIRCEQIVLSEDRVQGRIDASTIEIRRDNPVVDAEGMPQGRNQAIIHGNVERLDKDHIVLEDGDFTVCDCGHDKLPSWRLDSSKIEVTLGDRAIIYWPQMNVSPFGLFTMPILPPLLPLSIPLKRRAAGFLPPVLQFLDFPWPTLDVPFFYPLGESHDLTITPGMRTGWRAPRLGLRWRYTPTEETNGQLQLQLTHDGAHRMAGDRPPVESADYNRRYALVDRLIVDWKHRSALSDNLDWLVDGRWLSDDLINQDFMVTVEERITQYVPSRTELMWRSPNLAGVLSADYMLSLNNPAPDGSGPLYSNLGAGEANTWQRGPYINLQLMPTPVVKGVHSDANLSFVRYGSWLGSVGTELAVTQGSAGLAYLETLGPVNVTARAGLDSVIVDSGTASAIIDTALLLRGDAEVRGVGPLAGLTHLVVPRLSYRAMPRIWAPASAHLRHDLDERLVRRVVHQGMATLHQSLWASDRGTALASLDLSQPWDLMTGKILPPFAEINWSTQMFGNGTLWTSVDLARTDRQPIRELGGRLAYALGPVSLSAQYLRLAPDADRFQRSIYELVAPRLPPRTLQASDRWAHNVRAGAAVRLGGVNFAYGAGYTLARPDVDARMGEDICLSGTHPDPSKPKPLRCFTGHTLSVGYVSPCDCWAINTVIAVDPLNPKKNIRFSVTFDVAGYRIGAAPTKH